MAAVQSAGARAVELRPNRRAGRGAPAAAARAAEARLGLSASARLAGSGRVAARAGSTSIGTRRSSGSSSGSSGTGARSVKRWPLTAAAPGPTDRHRAARRGHRADRGPAERRCIVAARAAQTTRASRPGCFRSRLCADHGAGRLDLAGGEPRLQPTRLDLGPLRALGHRARRSSAVTGSAHREQPVDAEQEQVVAEVVGRPWRREQCALQPGQRRVGDRRSAAG